MPPSFNPAATTTAPLSSAIHTSVTLPFPRTTVLSDVAFAPAPIAVLFFAAAWSVPELALLPMNVFDEPPTILLPEALPTATLYWPDVTFLSEL